MRVLVVGCASDVWRDVETAQRLGSYDAVYCVKQMGIHWPDSFSVWATLHPESMDEYESERVKLGHPSGYEIVAPPAKEVGMHGKKGRVSRRVTYKWPGMGSSASSGIYAVKVALDDGADKVVLAGVPMQADAGHFLPKSRTVTHRRVRGQVWAEHGQFMVGLNYALPFLRERVRSVSGHTREILGAPTPEWLSQGSESLSSARAGSPVT